MSTREIDRFPGSFMQLPLWANIKSNWSGRYLRAFADDGQECGSALLLCKTTPLLGTLVYLPRGPVCAPGDTQSLRALLVEIEAEARRLGACLLRADPPVTADSPDAAVFAELGFCAPQADCRTTIQTAENYLLPLGGRNEEELLASFSSKCRYNIRLAERKGLVCRDVDPAVYLPVFYTLMQQTGQRDGFPIRPFSYFERLFRLFDRDHCRLYLCFLGDLPLSGAVAVRAGGCVSYVYGASADEHRELMPSYLMQWEMIRWSLACGCGTYDMMGIPKHDDESAPEYGMYRFKRGFGGEAVVYAGQFDKIYHPVRVQLFAAVCRARKKLSHLSAALHRLR